MNASKEHHCYGIQELVGDGRAVLALLEAGNPPVSLPPTSSNFIQQIVSNITHTTASDKSDVNDTMNDSEHEGYSDDSDESQFDEISDEEYNEEPLQDVGVNPNHDCLGGEISSAMPQDGRGIVPTVGMEFESEKQVHAFWKLYAQLYALQTGFG